MTAASLALPLYGCSQCGVLAAPPNGEPPRKTCGIRRGAWKGQALNVCEGVIVAIGTLAVTPPAHPETT